MKHSPEFSDALAVALVQAIWMLATAALVVPVMVGFGGDVFYIGVPLLMIAHSYLLAYSIRSAIRAYRKPLQRK